MKFSRYVLLFLIGLGVLSLVAIFEAAPGYMDAEYYYAGGQRLAAGQGFSELVLWNFLDDPAGIPHPSHAYWMPLASLLAALGMKVTGVIGFSAGKLGFILLAACLPPLTAALALTLTHKQDLALLAGLLAVFPVFYLAYLPTTDTFGLYMLLGGLIVGIAALPWQVHSWQRFVFPLLLGVLAGLMHLARADGILWLLIALLVPAIKFSSPLRFGSDRQFSKDWLYPTLTSGLLVIAGYIFIMGPWMVRNLSVFGTPLAPGGARALWVTNYDELFRYPAALLTPGRWLSFGWEAILQARLWALGQNLQTALAVQGEIFLAPLMLWGFWRLRRQPAVQIGGAAWLLTFIVMTLVFPFAGARGGFFHSGAAVQPLLFVLAISGLEGFIEWGVRARGWKPTRATNLFGFTLVGIALLLSVVVVRGRVIGADAHQPAWSATSMLYTQVDQALQAAGAQPGAAVLVNDAPGYYLASGRPAISIPNGDQQVLMAVAERYAGQYLVLEIDQVTGLGDLFAHPRDVPGLHYLKTVGGEHLFRFEFPATSEN